jgi:putative membrane protein
MIVRDRPQRPAPVPGHDARLGPAEHLEKPGGTTLLAVPSPGPTARCGTTRSRSPSIPFTLMGLPLAIFLGFRNNAAYDRYWEGRKQWGELVLRSRNLARQCLSLVDDAAQPDRTPAHAHDPARDRLCPRAAPPPARQRSGADVAPHLAPDEWARMRASPTCRTR